MKTATAAEDDGTIVVALTPEQEARAERWGKAVTDRRARAAIKFEARDRDQRHIEMMRARIALSVAVDRPYDGSSPTPERETGDVAPGAHARWTQPNGRLVIRNDDAPDHLYVMVVPAPKGALRIVGYICGRDAMVERHWRGDWEYPCWAVPRHALRPATTLQAELRLRAIADDPHGLDDVF